MSRKLTDEQKIEIIRLYLTGEYSYAEIARQFNVNPSSVQNLAKVRGIKTNVKRKTKYKVNENYFDIIDTPEKAYWMGWMYSDGANIGKGITISLQEEDKEILEKFKETLEYTGQLLYVDNKNKKDDCIRKPQWKLLIYNKHLSETMTKLGCPENKTMVLKFPNENQIPKHLLRHFIRGMWDGDGSFSYWVGKNKAKNGKVYEHFHVESSIVGTYNICRGVQTFIKEDSGIETRIKNIKGKESKRLKNTKMEDIYSFMIWLYKDSTIHLKRKYNKSLEIENILFETKRISKKLLNNA